MKRFFKRSAALLAGVLFLTSAAGCGDKEESEASDYADRMQSVAAEDMPYGASLAQLLTSQTDKVKIGIEYDNRYLTEEEAIKLSDYVAAINESDGELLEQTFYNPLLDYYMEQSEATDLTEYITSIHDNIKDNYIGYDYEFDYITVDDCVTQDSDDADSEFSSIDTVLKSLGDESILDKVTSKKSVTFDIEYVITGEEGSYMLSNCTSTSSNMYIYTIDGEIYIL